MGFVHLASSVDRLLRLDDGERAAALARRAYVLRILVAAVVLWTALVMPGVEFWTTVAGLVAPRLVILAHALEGDN